LLRLVAATGLLAFPIDVAGVDGQLIADRWLRTASHLARYRIALKALADFERRYQNAARAAALKDIYLSPRRPEALPSLMFKGPASAAATAPYRGYRKTHVRIQFEKS
jgi:hypothetical protein